MSIHENTTKSNESLHLSNQEESKRKSFEEEESEEELDEFGRVKRRRQKFKSERSDDEEEADLDKREFRRYRRRSSSRSRSPRRSYRRRYSDCESDEYNNSNRPNRHYHHQHHHHRSSRYPSSRYHPTNRSNSNGADMYSEAAQYIDTEFYSTKVYVGDLENVTERQLESLFSRFGALEDVKLVEGKDYGFVTFEKKEAALDAIRNLHGTLVGSKRIKVNRAKIPERNKVGFGNVPWQDEDGLLAKEISYEHEIRRSSLTTHHASEANLPLDTRGTAVPHRVLTSYDDL
ncbi:Glycine-rich RNA-binding protein RZ1B [Choanephora cucurbitarum]|uniref:Glycine-rich RNA-binding protein RZ1B n=1 Tax=Choanephora cucurbitarum TaxID=101091 RepID=A0A1C7MV95_9FUNG|nr:Glycine-rich RNA-binding protein RZ1B [Choanephora cucurbitarum]